MEETECTALVIRAQTEDRAACGALVTRFGPLVEGLCRGMTGTSCDAQDLAHDAFVEAWLKLPTLRDPGRFAAWLCAIARNLCRQWHRQRRREQTGLAEFLAEAHPNGTGGRDEEDPVATLATGLERLSSDHRLALALHYRQSLSYEEMAAFLQVPVGTVMSRLHRARERLKQRMAEMPHDDCSDPLGYDPLRRTVDAEIRVLLRVWEGEARQVGLDARYRSPTARRLSVLLAHSPDLVRPVLESMGDVLTEHVAIRVRRAGPAAVEVAVASAFAEDPELRRRARAVLRHYLSPAPDLQTTDPYFGLPTRQEASWLLDSVLRSGRTDADKVSLLVDLLPGCADHATAILLGCCLLSYPDDAFPRLWERWWSEGWTGDAPPSVDLAVLSRFGARFLAALVGELAGSVPSRVRQALAGAGEAAKRIGRSAFGPTPVPDPALEWRTTGRLRPEDIDPDVRQALCQALVGLVGEQDHGIRDASVSVLGAMGGPEHAVALRSCLHHPDASTRVAAALGLADLGDRDSAGELMRIAAEDQPPARRAAVAALARLGIAEAAGLLAGMVHDPTVGPQAVSALGHVGGEGRAELERLVRSDDRGTARLAASALHGGGHKTRSVSDTTRERLRRVRGEDARPLLHISVVGAIRNLPEARPYEELELTRLIAEVCGDYSTTRRELIMQGLMGRSGGVYGLTGSGLAVWRVERFLKDRYRARG